MGRELKAADIAERHNIHRTTAYRWLLQIEKQYGAAVVYRRGRRGVLVTTEDAFAAVAPLVASRSAAEQRIKHLEDRLADAEARADKQAEMTLQLQREFRAAAARWFSRPK